jgi:hypothetical protein
VKKFSLNTPYIIKPFKYHEEVKNSLLEFLDKAEYRSPEHEASETHITKADWFKASDMSREWVKFIAPKLVEEIQAMYRELGFDMLKISEIWFQQYLQGSEHGWHTHSGNWTNVYYLEFPEGSPKTTLIDPFDKKTIIEVDVKEGDLLVFPAFVMHKAPINESGNRKTILSYNIDADVSDDMYKEWMP